MMFRERKPTEPPGGTTIRNTASLRKKTLARKARVGVVGQGYVGLSLACAAAEAGFAVTGIDVDVRRIEELGQGILSVAGVDRRDFESAIDSGRVDFSDEPERLEQCDIIAICVPTPLRDNTPDLSYVELACKEVAQHLVPGTLVVLESTTYPGTTDEFVRPLLESSGLISGHDFMLAYSPERIDPGNAEFGFRNTPRLVGGMGPEATGAATLFYSQLVEKVVVMSSCKAAELAKLLENTFRHVNVALVNEIAMLSHEMGIDVWEVIGAAETKPFGFMPFYPGPGVGGHCIPLDPTYLSWHVTRHSGRHFRILEQSQDINAQMPAYVASRIGEALNDSERAVKSARILVLGVCYKPDVGDIRESPVLRTMQALAHRGARLSFHDPYVDSIEIAGSILQRTELTDEALAESDCVALLTPHEYYDLEWMAERAALVFDARNAYGPDRRCNVISL